MKKTAQMGLPTDHQGAILVDIRTLRVFALPQNGVSKILDMREKSIGSLLTGNLPPVAKLHSGSLN